MDLISSKKDFVINLWHYVWEYEEPHSDFYRNIYAVILNRFISVVFVPEVDRNVVSWLPIADPKIIDGANSVLEARLQTLATETYCVTPSRLLAGQEEKMPPPSFAPDSGEGVIFYVTPEEFEIYSREITMLDEKIGRESGGHYASELQNFKFVQLLLNRVITSKNFVH